MENNFHLEMGIVSQCVILCLALKNEKHGNCKYKCKPYGFGGVFESVLPLKTRYQIKGEKVK